MDDEINLRDIFHALWKSRRLISGTFMVSILIGGVICFVMPQSYMVSSIVDLGNFGDPVYTNPESAKGIMLDESFLLEVVERLGLNMSPGEFKGLKDSIKIGPTGGSDSLIAITITTGKKQEGKAVIKEMTVLFTNRSKESYNLQKKLLLDQIASVQSLLAMAENNTNEIRKSMSAIEETQGSSSEEYELRLSRALDTLNEEEARRLALVDRYLDLQRNLSLFKHLEVIQEPGDPVIPIGPRKALIIAIAGILGLMIGIFVVFLKEGLKKPAE